MTQPIWKCIANLGDVNPLDHGGLFVYIDKTGNFEPEMERVEPPCDDDPEGPYEVHRVILDRQKEVRDGDTIYLVPASYQPDWRYPVSAYPEWYVDSLGSVAESMDYPEVELRSDLCSTDTLKRAQAYRAIADYHGWANFDAYPIRLTRVPLRRLPGLGLSFHPTHR